MALLSIIVPVYNIEQFLEKCVDSILAQSFTDFELILVDDGSTDGCGAICDRYADLDSRVLVIHKENGGLVSARKAGLAVASGTYVSYVDGDDWIDRDIYRYMISNAQTYNCDLVMCDVEHEHNKKKIRNFTAETLETGYYGREELEEKIFPIMLYGGTFYYFGIYPVIWNKLFRRDMLISHQFAVDDNIKTGEDAACVYPYLLEAKSMYFMKDQFLYHYRHSSVQMTASYDNDSFNRFKSLYNFFNRSNLAKSKYSSQLDFYYANAVKTIISNELRKENTIPFRKKLENITEIIQFSNSQGFVERMNIEDFPTKHRLYFKLFLKSHTLTLVLCIKAVKLLEKFSVHI